MRILHVCVPLLYVSLCLGCGRFGFELSSHDSQSDLGDRDPGELSPTDNPTGSLGDGGTQASDVGDSGTSSGDASAAGSMGEGGATSACTSAARPKHRYPFENSGSTAPDVIGGADGDVLGATLDGSGSVNLDGNGDYVALPAGLLNGLNAVTIMLWVEWKSGGQRQTLFDVGATEEGPGMAGTPLTHVQLKVSTPQSGFVLTTKTANGTSDLSVFPLLSVGSIDQVAVVLDGTRDVVTLYKNGERIDDTTLTGFTLSDIDDVDFRLGGTLQSGDASFRGRLHEARIYPSALNDCQIALADTEGADGDTDLGCDCP